LQIGEQFQASETMMEFLKNITFDQVACSLFIFALVRTLLVAYVPDNLIGPGGWLIDTEKE
jgi:hypothetical protein